MWLLRGGSRVSIGAASVRKQRACGVWVAGFFRPAM